MARILVVDDEQSLLNLIVTVLEEAGHSVFTARHGKEALALIETELPHLIISDVMMPVMDGLTLLEEVRARPKWEAVKVILISAAPIKNTTVVKADHYLGKPYDIDTLEEIVESLIKSSEPSL